MELNRNQIEKLYQITEVNLDWFNEFYPEEKATFSELLKLNYQRLKEFVVIDKLSNVSSIEIDLKLERMSIEFNGLFDLTYQNKKDRNPHEKTF